MKFLVSLVALSAAASLALASGVAAAAQDPVLASFRGGSVTRSEFEGYQRWRSGDDGYAKLRRDPVALRGEVTRFAVLKITVRLAEEAGVQRGAEFRARVRQYENQLLSEKWHREIREKVVVGRGEVEKLLPKNLEEERTVYWASFPTAAEAARFTQAVRGGSGFQAAVTAAQVPVGAYGESKLSAHSETHFSEPTRAVVLNLAPGQVTDPREEAIGFYVLQLFRIESPQAQRERLSPPLRDQVLSEKRTAAEENALKDLRARARIVIDEAALNDTASIGSGKVVAEVNGEPISLSLAGPHGFPDHGSQPNFLRNQLEKYIDELVAAQEARRLGLEKNDAKLTAAVWYKSLETIAEFYRNLAGSAFTVSEEEARQYWAENADQYQTDAMARIAHIVLHSEFIAKKYRQDILSGASTFEDVARKLSEDRDSAERGGDLGWFVVNTLKEPYKAYIEPLRVGEVSVPIYHAEKYFLVKLVERLEPKTFDFEAVRSKVLPRALLAKKTGAYQDFIARKLKEEQVRLDEQQIRRLAK